MKPIRLTTIGKIIWFFLIIILVVVLLSIMSMFKKDEPRRIEVPEEKESEKIINYVDSRSYVYDFDNNTYGENDTINIKESGTYKLSGTNDTYKLVVDCPSGIVKIIFSNFKTSVVYDLINIKKAYKVVIEFEDGSENSIISDLLEQDGVANPTIISSNADVEISGTGKLVVETIGNFLVSKANLEFKDAVMEVNSINNGIKLDGNFSMNSGTLYMFASDKGLVSLGNSTINGGTFIIRSSDTALQVSGILLINAGKTFIASLNEIQKPNANSLQKSMVLHFKEPRDGRLFFHDTTQVTLVYAGELDYQHILYSDEFKTDRFALYGNGKVAGVQVYGLYKPEDSMETMQLTYDGSTNDRFELNELVNVYEDIVKKWQSRLSFLLPYNIMKLIMEVL